MGQLNQLNLNFIKQSRVWLIILSRISLTWVLKLKFYVLLHITGGNGGCLNFDTVSILTRGMLCQMGI